MQGGARLAQFVRDDAARHGFSAMGIARAELDGKHQSNLAAFVAANFHGSMDWMPETLERRSNPKTLWPDAKSVIMLAMNYGPAVDPVASLGKKNCGAISVYARNRDYHDVIKGRLKTMAARLLAEAGRHGIEGDVKVFVDTAPVMEKPLAEKAGLGWQGKHTNLVSREFGSWLFLGSIFTTLDLAHSSVEKDHCGSCRSCLDACPTDAFPAPYKIDARRCISYLTIENRDPVPREFRKAMGNRIYGCDDCLAACPWNKFSQQAEEIKLSISNDWQDPSLGELLGLDDPSFRTKFSGSPIKRIGRDRFVRNVLIAAGNSRDTRLVSLIESLLRDAAPLVRGAAVWALGQLDPDRLLFHTDIQSSEHHSDVQLEWRESLKEQE